MNKKETISVIVPIYNIEKYIEKCVNSVIRQTYSNLDIILVDDGSTDESGAICDIYREHDNRIRVIHKKNGGLSDARNCGIKAARGEWIVFVDGDDWVDKDFVLTLWKTANKYKVNCAMCAYRNVPKESKKQVSKLEYGCISGETALKKCLMGEEKSIFQIAVWNRIYRKKSIENILFPVGTNYEDIMYTTKVLLQMDRISYINVRKYNYMSQRLGSIMNEDFNENSAIEHLSQMRERTDYLMKMGYLDIALISNHLQLILEIIYHSKLKYSHFKKKEYLMKKVEEWYKNDIGLKSKTKSNINGNCILLLYRISPALCDLTLYTCIRLKKNLKTLMRKRNANICNL